MEKINLTEISVYPIKSTIGLSLESTKIEKSGIPYDRNFAIIDQNDKIITARENPLLLKIHSKVKKGVLELSAAGKESIKLVINEISDIQSISVGIFKDFTKAITFEHELNKWISTVLQEPSRLVSIDPNAPRKMKEKYNALAEDEIPFCDVAPIHLVSESSLAELNSNLDQAVNFSRFRPNLVVKGAPAFAEDTWKTMEIGSCIFDVAVKTARCNFITIDPKTSKANEQQEPLRTLSQMRKLDNEVTFGIYLIPRQLGVIKKGDNLRIS